MISHWGKQMSSERDAAGRRQYVLRSRKNLEARTHKSKEVTRSLVLRKRVPDRIRERGVSVEGESGSRDSSRLLNRGRFDEAVTVA